MPSLLQEHLRQGLLKSMQRQQPQVVSPAAPEPAVSDAPLKAERRSQLPETRKIESLSPAAREVLKALVQAGGFINVAHMEVYVHGKRVPYATLRSSIARLSAIGLITSRCVGNFGMTRGMRYTLSDEALSGKQIDEYPKSLPPPEVHPELILWRDNGISEKQIGKWESEFGISHELMTIYMKWCAWDAKHRDIKSISNWFYSVLKKSGGYPKPEGYVSLEEQRLAEMEKIKAEEKAIRDREAALKQEEADKGVAEYFDAMMLRGDADETYRELEASLPDFTRRMKGGPGDKVFRGAMWNAFRKKAGL